MLNLYDVLSVVGRESVTQVEVEKLQANFQGENIVVTCGQPFEVTLKQIEKEEGPIEDLLVKGELGRITNWLNGHIHQYGAAKTPIEIIKDTCQEGINIQPLLQYFEEKYKKISHL